LEDVEGRIEVELLRIIRQRLGHVTRGEELAETAMILPLLFLLLIGIYWFGQAFRIYGTITNAARDGARAAVDPACTTCSSIDPTQNAWTIVQNDLNSAHINPQLLQQPTVTPTMCQCSPTGTTNPCSTPAVSCDGNQNNICVQGVTHSGIGNTTVTESLVQLSSTVAPSGLTNGGAGECGISVSFQYPFQFWLPFTSINNRTVNLRAQAQMRAETQ
jgi:Flp pilus assembly protein TadG